MNIEAFHDLIRSGDRTNAEIAWQIARGMRDSGDKDFEAFCKAVYGWAFSDIPNQKPADFLANLMQKELNRKIHRKTQIPETSYTLAPLVEKINIEDLQTKTLPVGFEVFDQLKVFNFSTQTLPSLGDELSALQSLQKIDFHSLHPIELKPEFENCKNIKTLALSSWKTVTLPENISSMGQLKELVLKSEKIIGPVWDCEQLDALLLSNMSYSVAFEELGNFWDGLANMKKLRKLSLVLPHVYKKTYLPDSIYEMENLKELHILSNHNRSNDKYEFGEGLSRLQKLEVLSVYTLNKNDLKLVVQLPNLRKIYIRNHYDQEKINDFLVDFGIETDIIPN